MKSGLDGLSATRYTSRVVAFYTGLLRERENQVALSSVTAPTFSRVRSRPVAVSLAVTCPVHLRLLFVHGENLICFYYPQRLLIP